MSAQLQYENRVLEFPIQKGLKSSDIQKELDELGTQGFQVVGSTTVAKETQAVLVYTLTRSFEPLPAGWDGSPT